jgi:hypothetical protein
MSHEEEEKCLQSINLNTEKGPLEKPQRKQEK